MRGLSHATSALSDSVLQGYLDCAGNTLGRKREVDGTAELVRDEIANEAGSVALLRRSRYWRTTRLAPHDDQDGRGIAAVPAFPAYGHPALRDRQCAVFGGVRYKLVQHHRQRFGCRGGKRDVGPASRRICLRRIRSQLVADNVRDANALPIDSGSITHGQPPCFGCADRGLGQTRPSCCCPVACTWQPRQRVQARS